jgi:hypothetical protein
VLDYRTTYYIVERVKYEFVQLLAFSAKARKLRLTLEDFREIENEITSNPARWPVVPGTHGLRKMRFAPAAFGGGKSGGLRVCYFIIDAVGRVYLVTLFAKNEKDNLTKAEARDIAVLIAGIKSLHKNQENRP